MAEAEEGHSQREIADVLGVSKGTVGNDSKPDAQDWAPESEDSAEDAPPGEAGRPRLGTRVRGGAG